MFPWKKHNKDFPISENFTFTQILYISEAKSPEIQSNYWIKMQHISQPLP